MVVALRLRREGRLPKGFTDEDVEKLARSCTNGPEVVDENLVRLRELVWTAQHPDGPPAPSGY